MAESGPTDSPPSSSGLDVLITEVAMDLMGVRSSEAAEAIDRVLDRLVEFFTVDDTFVRRHRPDRVSELVTIRPARDLDTDKASPEILAEIHFDSDPVFQVQEHLKEPFVLYPENSEAVQELVQSGMGVERSSFAIVPLLREDLTVGILALVRFTDQRWEDDELRTLFAVATMIAQFWSRLDAEEKLAYQAHHDEMTGLPNRLRMAEQIAAASAADRLSLLSLNIDNMKVINDGLDFELGDRFICGFAERLTRLVRDDTVVARTGGDQFCVLVPNTDPGNVEKIATRLLDAMRRSIDVGDIKISRSVSIGIAHKPADDDVEHDLFVESEAALHLAKKAGKNRFRVFDAEVRQELIEKFEQELALRRAIEAGDFVLHYQPSVDLRTGAIRAVEALVRWDHPTDGLLTAGAFIETAEESGLVVEIGDFVLDAAIAQMSRWQHDHPELEMWINVSPAQLMSRDLVAQVAMLLAEYDVSSSRICLEVTEHVVLDDMEGATGALERLRAMGVRLALDDFGTGYSSMKQLKSLPVDCLKIDMSFVAGLGKSEHDEAIVDAAITLADAFGLCTVAEGVETEEQVDELLNRGCGQAQGFLLAPPQSANDVEKLLRAAPKPHEVKI